MATLIKDKETGKWLDVNGQTMWVGTKAELAVAVANGSLPEGTKVMVTDDFTKTGFPIGTVLANMATTTPANFLLCDGSEFDETEYPELYEALGTNKVPDLREVALVGAGQNTTHTIASHDVYALGEFKDDQLQSHTHTFQTRSSGSGGNSANWANGSVYSNPTTTANSGRSGTVTRGKRLGVNYIIAAR